VADEGVLVDRTAAMRDRPDLQHRVHPPRAVGARIFAERRLGAAFDRPNFAFQHDLGVGRHVERDGLATHQRHRALQHAAGDLDLVGIELGKAQRANEKGRVVPDHDGDRAGQAALLVLLPDDVAVGGFRELHAEQVLLMHHVPVDADVADAGLRIAHHGEAGGDVLAGVLLVIRADRQRLDIDLRAGQHHLLNRRLVHHHRIDRMCLPRRAFLDEGFDVAVLDAKTEPQPLEARVHVGNERDGRAFDVLEDHQREFPVALQPLQDAGHAEPRIDLTADPHHLLRMLLLKELDEAAQIGRVGRVGRRFHGCALPQPVAAPSSVSVPKPLP
jgi:hypothetical protein